MRRPPLDGYQEDGLIHETVWPEHTGVAGFSLHSASATYSQRLATAALDAIDTWSRRHQADAGTSLNASDFPFADVLDHYQAVGRIAASASLVGKLARLNVCPAGEDGTWAQRRLVRWLRSTTDQFDGDYHTYAGTGLHEALSDDAPFGTPERTTDVLTLALLMDLLRTETEALADAPSGRQSKRTHAVIHAARRIGQLAPGAVSAAPELCRALEVLHRRSGGEREMADWAAKAAGGAARLGPAMDLAGLTMLPVTPLHDEQMFLRNIQIFECLYLQTARNVESATAALEDRDPPRAAALLADVARRLAATPALHRVLTTMPPETFAIIRKHTAGRSAVQSRAFQRVEQASAPPERGTDLTARVEQAPRAAAAPGPTLQEAFLRARGRLPAWRIGEVREAMKDVDDNWCALKRSHWGITLKIIGSLPGTGGTSGAEYLYGKSQIPLFPALAAPDQR
jgi:tryptophan 2,3-dioxygenase